MVGVGVNLVLGCVWLVRVLYFWLSGVGLGTGLVWVGFGGCFMVSLEGFNWGYFNGFYWGWL